MVRRFARRFLAFLLAILTMVVLGSTAHSLFVQHAWQSAAASVSPASEVGIATADRLQWVLHDLVGMEPIYGVLTATALLLGLLVAGAVARFTGGRLVVFALGGASCIFAMFSLLKLILGSVGVFGARGAAGLAVQMLAGLLAAVVFAAATSKAAAASDSQVHR
jgi:hypothetical protein